MRRVEPIAGVAPRAQNGAKARRARMLGLLCSATAILGAGQAAAQEASGDTVEEVVVTASRVARSGVLAPTPTTAIAQEELQASGLTNVADFLNTQVPSFRGSSTPTASVRVSGGGGNVLNLRGLGGSRTLVLVDGRRHVPTTATESLNINVIPQGLIERVEVVTGGASAAWGSDAVAGVANLIFKKKIDGLEGEVRFGGTDKGDNESYQVSLAYGAPLGDRGQFIIAGEVGESGGIDQQSDRDWGRAGWQMMANPAATATNGQPLRLIVPNVHVNNATPGGVILSPASLIPGGRLEFLPGGATAILQPGSITGAAAQVGGGGINASLANTLAIPEEHASLYGRATFDFTDTLSGFAELSYAQSKTDFLVTPSFDSNLAISRNNAFLPASVRASMAAQNLSELRIGRLNYDFGLLQSRIEDKVVRGVVGLQGKVGTWDWDAYYTRGRVENMQAVDNNRINALFAQSVDSAIDPVSGQAVCRNAANGCVPVNLFGNGSPSPAALAFFSGSSVWDTTIVQDVVAANLRGEPVSTWAGPVALAVGAEYRREKVDFAVDPLSQAQAFFTHNARAYSGTIEVKEAYAEVIAPLLRDVALAKSLDLNGALRVTDYSTSGQVETWKVGAVYEPIEGLRFRGTRSRDIRAPNAQELFSAGTASFTTLIDPRPGGGSATVQVFGGGNRDLKAEKADTTTLGLTFRPSSLPGFEASFDWYDIDLKGAIGSLGAQVVVNRCYAGEADLCAVVQRDPTTQALQAVTASVINISSLKTRGQDIDVSYRFDLSRFSEKLPGTANLRLIATHVDELVTSDGTTRKDAAGSLGPTNAIGGVPEWRYTISAGWQDGPLNLNLAGRYVGGGKWDRDFGPADINENDVDSAFYVDATVRYDILREDRRTLTAFASIRNAFDQDPPVAPSPDFNGPPTNSVFYDVIGRYMSAGVSFKY